MKRTLLAAVLLPADCASMNKDECVSANWYAVGLEDGAEDQSVERLGEHRRACAEHKASPDAERYAAWHCERLKTFCIYERGYARVRAGKSYFGICPPELRDNFLAGYDRGINLYDVKLRLDRVNQDIRKTKEGLSERRVSPGAREQLAERLVRLSREAAQLEREMASLSRRQGYFAKWKQSPPIRVLGRESDR